MVYAIVGHRGVGKTSFIQRVKYYYELRNQACHVFDLDSEIEQREGQSIADIFKNHGEKYFRQTEELILNQILNECEILSGIKYISLGAGYQGKIPENVRVIWLRRNTDQAGRVFLDRPRLEHEMAPLAEYMSRFEERAERYRRMSHKEIYMAEGWDFINPYEPILLGIKPAHVGGCVTIMPHILENDLRLELFIKDHLLLGIDHIELRDDLLSFEQIQKLTKLIPTEKVLISFRKNPTDDALIKLSGIYKTDWAIELGPSPLLHNDILSLHERWPDETVDDAARRLLAYEAKHYKLSLEVDNFVDLWAGHKFYADNPERVSFLPRSKVGRWQWYRALQGSNMKINFLRYGEGSSLDQPIAFDYIRRPKFINGFAAVLGDPVWHSRTPAEQNDFFAERDMVVYAIQIREEECNALTLGILHRLGLRAAAVTSPLKKIMLGLCQYVDKRAEDMRAVNTIVSIPGGWRGTNTDVNGVQGMFSTIDVPQIVAVWGGGGTRQVLRAVLPHAHFFSARKGEEIWCEDHETLKARGLMPEVVVWALGRSRLLGTIAPPSQWRPKYIMDMNYSEDSPGREYAMRVGARYISGKGVFKTQARSQREYWSNELG